MGVLHPIYTDGDLKGISIADRQKLSQAIFELLRNDPEVKTLLKSKTHGLYHQMRREKPPEK
jgi:hypothetical protein